MNAFVYMRCSGRGQIDGDTWDRQTAAINACALAKLFTVAGEYRDEGISGKNDEDCRPGFQQMISDMLAKGVTTVIVESLDRLAREYRIQEQLIIYLASKGLTLIAANTGEDITAAMMGDPMRRALVQIQGIFAELDKNLIVAKLRKARQRQRDQGGKCEGRKGYGEKAGEDAVLQSMINLRGMGYSPEAIADDLNTRRVKTRYGKDWHPMTIEKILKRHAPAPELRQS